MNLPSVIWKEICDYLSPTEVKNIRLTSKSLSTETAAMDKLLKCTKVLIRSCQDLETYTHTSSLLDNIFLELKAENVTGTEANTLEEFINHPSFNLLESRIRGIIIACKFTRASLFLMLTKTNNRLSSLVIDCNYWQDDDQNEDLETIQELLPTALPNMEKITPKNGKGIHQPWLKKIIERSPSLTNLVGMSGFVIMLLSEDETGTMLRRLEKIEIEDSLESTLVARLINYGLQIKDLQLHMRAFTSVLPILEKVWNSTLRSLRIMDWDHKFLETNRSFPKLESLKKLVLVGESMPGGLYYFREEGFKGSLEILKDLPGLNSLSLQIISFPNYFPTTFSFTTNITSLQVVQWPLPSNLVEPMGRMFVNLKKLDYFDISNEALLLVFQHLNNLEELSVGTAISDYGITGLRVRNKEVIIQKAHQGECIQEFRKPLGYFIGSLPHLKRITILSTKITDVSVILGLAYCKKLTSIRIERPVLSDRSFISLANAALDLQSLDLRVDHQITLVGLSSIKQKYPECYISLVYYTTNEQGIQVRNTGLFPTV